MFDHDDPLTIPRPTESGWVLLVYYDPASTARGVLPVRRSELEKADNHKVRELLAGLDDGLDLAVRDTAAKLSGHDDWSRLTYDEAVGIIRAVAS